MFKLKRQYLKIAEYARKYDSDEDSVSEASDDDDDSAEFELECDCDSESGECCLSFEAREVEEAFYEDAFPKRGRKRRQGAKTCKGQHKKRKITLQSRPKLATGTGDLKKKVRSINCAAKGCKRTVECDKKMQKRALADHDRKPACGCDGKFSKKGELNYHSSSNDRSRTTWICTECPVVKTSSSVAQSRKHSFLDHKFANLKCASDQCPFTGKTGGKSVKYKSTLTNHRRVHSSTSPFF